MSWITLSTPGYRPVSRRRPDVTDVTEADGHEAVRVTHVTLTPVTLRFAGVLRREAADRCPIEVVTALREDPEKSVVQKTAERHGDA